MSIFFQLIHDKADDPDAFNVVPHSEFCVARVAYANNTSKYTIDGKTATWGEVGTLLKSHGVELDNNRFLILQGMMFFAVSMAIVSLPSPHYLPGYLLPTSFPSIHTTQSNTISSLSSR
ncbi:hypothetical protein EON64_02930 [archaeon]|nr:MAG: hypothetical protein EON64_02930 [archaeon]